VLGEGDKRMAAASLDGRVAIVTGAAGGIGRAYCLALGSRGCAMVAADIADSQPVADEIIAAGGRAIAVRTDVSDQQSTKEMASAALGSFGRVDVLVNNAAYYLTLTQGPFEDIPALEWDRAFAVNVRGPWLCSRAVFPYMKAAGYGKIINVSSTTVWDGTTDFVHYVGTKAAMLGFTRALAREVGPLGIAVNTVTPDYTPHDSEFVSRQAADLDEIITSRRCFRRSQRPDDMVGVVLFLSGPGSDHITGQNFLVNGGGVFQ
jgi:NAD(P)-dependent dehydrogenase (short-subunit alcohol dehydrogenase family)